MFIRFHDVVFIQFIRVSIDFLIDILCCSLQPAVGEVAIFVVDSFELASIDSNELADEEVQLTAEACGGAVYLPDSCSIVPTEVGDRLMVWHEFAGEPDHFRIAMGFLLQATT
jgi:hypothetical protein